MKNESQLFGYGLIFVGLVALVVAGGLAFKVAGGSADNGDDALAKMLQTNVPEHGSAISLNAALRQISGPRTSSQTSASGSIRKNVQATIAREFSQEENDQARLFFAKVISDPNTRELYDRSRKLLAGAGDGAARWITLGGIMTSDDEYANALHLALKEANQQPAVVLAEIQKMAPELRRDPFIYQMAMNLNYQLDLSAEERGRFFGEELEYQLENLNGPGGDSFWVAVMGLTLAKEAGVPQAVLRPHLEMGLKRSKGSEFVLAEVRKTIEFYFPEMDIN
jgi:hypothetical protein